MKVKVIGKTAKINLTTGDIRMSPTDQEDIRNFLGGRGLNVLELIRNLPEPNKVDAFDPSNPLIFGLGLLTGTMAPNAARFNVTALSPETKILGDANAGGFFGPAMKYAGFDRLIIVGKCKTPSLILLRDGEILIQPAEHLWGLDTQTTQQVIWDTIGNEVETACIGPAGENLVRMACIINRVKNSASRGGMGAVMGSKNLKAIVADGNYSIETENPNEFFNTVVELKDYLNGSKIVQTLRTLGTPLLYEPSNLLGAIRTKNSQNTQFSNNLKAEEFHKYSKGAMACANCIVHCRHANSQGGEGPEYSTVGILGANLGLDNPNQVIILNNMCNELGLDTSSTGGIISWFIEMYQKGILKEPNMENLEFGNFPLIQSLLIKISNREGIGDRLAESTQFLYQIKERREEAAGMLIAVKGLPQSDPHDCRYIKSFALGIGTASRGADHLRSRPTLEIFDLPEKLTTEIYGKPVNTNPTSYDDKGWIVSTHENIYAVGDALGICRFVTHSFNSPHLLKYEHFADLIKYSVGIEGMDLETIGKNTINLERFFNQKCGLSKEDDYPPARYMNEEADAGVAKGHKIERHLYSEMLDEYYEAKGWTPEGYLTKNQVKELESLIGD